MNEAACSWGWFCVWLKEMKCSIKTKDNGDVVIIKLYDTNKSDWRPVKDAIEILKNLFKYKYLAQISYGMFTTPNGFETFADEQWRELSEVLIINSSDEILIKKY